MNRGKLEVVRQEIARVNIDILGISKLKGTGIREFNSDHHYIYYCEQESLRRNGVAIIVKCSSWIQPKNNRIISVHFQGKPFNITTIQVYATTTNAKEAEVDQFYEELQHQKDVLFIIRDWNPKVGREEIPGVTDFGLGVEYEAGQRLTEFYQENTGHSKHLFPTTQETTPHGHQQMVNTKIRLIIFFAAKDGETLYSQQKQDLGLTVAQIVSFS